MTTLKPVTDLLDSLGIAYATENTGGDVFNVVIRPERGVLVIAADGPETFVLVSYPGTSWDDGAPCDAPGVVARSSLTIDDLETVVRLVIG